MAKGQPPFEHVEHVVQLRMRMQRRAREARFQNNFTQIERAISYLARGFDRDAALADPQ